MTNSVIYCFSELFQGYFTFDCHQSKFWFHFSGGMTFFECFCGNRACSAKCFFFTLEGFALASYSFTVNLPSRINLIKNGTFYDDLSDFGPRFSN